MTEMFGEAWPTMSVPDLAPDDDDDDVNSIQFSPNTLFIPSGKFDILHPTSYKAVFLHCWK